MVVSGRVRVVAVALALAGCERGEVQSVGTPVARTPVNDAKAGVAARLAPMVYLAKEDRYRPMDADAFIASSELWWAHERVGCQDERIAPKVNVDDLANGRYEHTADVATPGGPDAECVHQGQTYHSNESTRPYDADGPPGPNGFYLNVDDARRPGDGTGAPVYWQYFERGAERAYMYWLFYAYNDAPGGVFDHEGDWERVAVRTDERDQPVGVTLWRHEGSCGLPWNNAEKVDGRAVAYSATGTHASYAAAGEYSIPFENFWIKDRTARGDVRWDLGAYLKRVEEQNWWRYGGGWGAVGASGAFATHRSGPAGPTPGRSADSAWPQELCRDQDKLTVTIDQAFIGNWKSPQPVDQPGSFKTFYVRLSIQGGGGIGDTVGSSFQPGLGCSGVLALIEAGPGVLKVRDTISSDPKLSCVKQTEITLRLAPTGLDYESVGDGTRSTAKLERDPG